MSDILKKRISVDAHCRQYSERDQRNRHYNDFQCAGQRNYQFRIAHQNQQYCCLHCIPRFKKSSEYFAGICIVGGYRKDIFMFVIHSHLPILRV